MGRLTHDADPLHRAVIDFVYACASDDLFSPTMISTPARLSARALLVTARALLGAALIACALPAWAQMVCNSVGDTAFCQGAEGSSTMSQIGDITYVSRSDGSTATHQRVGDTTFITDSREGMSGVAQHLGDTMIIQLSGGSILCNKSGPTMWCS